VNCKNRKTFRRHCLFSCNNTLKIPRLNNYLCKWILLDKFFNYFWKVVPFASLELWICDYRITHCIREGVAEILILADIELEEIIPIGSCRENDLVTLKATNQRTPLWCRLRMPFVNNYESASRLKIF